MYNLPENKTRRFGYISSYDKREKTRKEVSSHLGLVEYHFVDAQFFTVDLEFKCCTSLIADFYKWFCRYPGVPLESEDSYANFGTSSRYWGRSQIKERDISI